MDWKKLISDLTEAGVKQEEIAAECGVSQTAVSDLNRGATKSPSFDFGSRLVALHKERIKPSERSTASPAQSDIDTYVRPCSRGVRRDGPSNRREER